MSETLIQSDTSNSITTITLERPDKRNAMTPGMLDQLLSAIEAVDNDTRAVILQGSGPTFCAGFDLKMCANDPSGDTIRALLTGLSNCVRALRALPQPVVLSIHGAAVAGGCALLGGADIVVAHPETKLGYPVVKIGVSPAVSAPFLSASIPDGPARALLMDPDLIRAQRALELGLIHELDEHTHDRALKIAQTLANKPIAGVRATKALCNEIGSPRTDRADNALRASLSGAGSEEERAMLGALWS